MFCMNCGHHLPDGAKFCSNCGTSLQVNSSPETAPSVINVDQSTKLVPGTCTNCGASLQVDPSLKEAVCPACGTPYIVQQAINNININRSGTICIENAVINLSGTNVEPNAAINISGTNAEQNIDYSVMLTSFNNDKMRVIKAYMDYKSCGLKEAKDKIESAPFEIIRTPSETEAESVAKLFTSVGATVDIKQV